MDLTKILKVNDTVYSPIGGNGIVTDVNFTTKTNLPIRIQWENGNSSTFTKDGKYFTDSPECLLFPSKENRNWDTFKRGRKTSLKPFDKVLVRSDDSSFWNIDFYSYYDINLDVFITSGGGWNQCIPYNSETEHLVGTTEKCPDKYIIW